MQGQQSLKPIPGHDGTDVTGKDASKNRAECVEHALFKLAWIVVPMTLLQLYSYIAILRKPKKT